MRGCGNKWLVTALAAILLLVLFAVNILFGSVDIPIADVCSVLLGESNGKWDAIIMDVRLPRALTALFAGAAISVAGLILQTLFNNPLAGPEVLGVNSGAGLGAAIVILLSQSTVVAGALGVYGFAAILLGAFIGSLFVIALILMLSSMLRNRLYLLLAGVALSYIFSSAISILNYFATSEGVHSYMIWGMGSFSAVSMEYMPMFVTIVALLLLVTALMMKQLNAILLGDAYAANLGVNVPLVQIVMLAVTGLLTATVTAFCGPVSFIGLAVPHIARLVLKTSNHHHLLPASILLGGAVALLCNIICLLPGESGMMPLGAITPLIGAPVIIYVLLRDRKLL